MDRTLLDAQALGVARKNHMTTAARIALIHAVQVAMAPVEHAFVELWPQARRTNLLDDSLAADLEQAGGLTPDICGRIARLADYAIESGAAGVLFTCSAFGEAIDMVARRAAVPVLKPNEAMFEAALAAGGRIGMLATFAPAVESMEQEFAQLAHERGAAATLRTVCVPGAIGAARSGDIGRHDELVAQAAPQLADCDALLLAHFSTSTALRLVQQRVGMPVFTAPGAAVASLKRRLSGEG